MTTLDAVAKKKPEPSAEELAAKELVRLAREQGLSLTGPDGLLKQFTKSVLETALNEEMTEHLGHEKHRAPEHKPMVRAVTVVSRARASSPLMTSGDDDPSCSRAAVACGESVLAGHSAGCGSIPSGPTRLAIAYSQMAV